jgi:dimethylargininase
LRPIKKRRRRLTSEAHLLLIDDLILETDSRPLCHWKNMFTYAIVRTPAKSMIDGITTANLGVPDYEKALRQHQAYVEALRACGLTVITLPAAEDFPDSCFVEDTALLTKRCAIIARPGAPTRQGEEAAVLELLPRHFDHIESIVAPGTIEPGDIMMVGDHF